MLVVWYCLVAEYVCVTAAIKKEGKATMRVRASPGCELTVAVCHLLPEGYDACESWSWM